MSNVQVVQRAYEAFGRGDIATVLALMDPDIAWSEAEGNPYQPSGEPWKGPDAIVENLFMKIGVDYDGSFVIHPEIFHDAGDTVIVEGRYAGTCKSTGKTLDAQYCHVFRVREGLVTGFQQFVDTAQLQDVMGRR